MKGPRSALGRAVVEDGDMRAHDDRLLREEQLQEEVLVLKDRHLRVPRVLAQRGGARHEKVVRRVHRLAVADPARLRRRARRAPHAVRRPANALKVE